MGLDNDGRDLGRGLDQLPSGLYRLRLMVRGKRLSDTSSSLQQLQEVRDEALAIRRREDDLRPGSLTRQAVSTMIFPVEQDSCRTYLTGILWRVVNYVVQAER